MRVPFKIWLLNSYILIALKNFHLKIKKKKSAFCASGCVQHFPCSNMQINFPLKVSLWWHSFSWDSEITRHYLAFLQQVYSISDGGQITFWLSCYHQSLIFPVRQRTNPSTCSYFILTGAKKLYDFLRSFNLAS